MTNEELLALGLNEEQIAGVQKLKGTAISNALMPITQERDNLKTLNDTLNTNINTLQDKVKGLEGIDVEKLQSTITTLNSEIETLKEDRQNEITQLEIKLKEQEMDFAISSMFKEYGVKNEKAVKALVDMEALANSGTGMEALLKSQLDEVKGTDGYLFESPGDDKAKFMGKTGGGASTLTPEEFNSMSYSERVELMNQNPDVYEKLRGE